MRETAEILEVSRPTVKKRFNGFIQEARRNGIMVAAQAHGIEKKVAELIELSSELRKNRATVDSCWKGAVMLERLKPFGVEISNLGTFVDDLYREAENEGLAPRELVRLNSRFKELKAETGRDYRQLVEDFGLKKEEVKSLAEEIKVLETQRRDNVIALRKELEDKKVTTASIEWFDKVRTSVREHGIEIEELEEFLVLLQNLRDHEYDIKKVLSFYEKITGLEEKHEQLSSEFERDKEDYLLLQIKKESTEKFLEEKKGIVAAVSELHQRGLDQEAITKIRDTVLRISTNRGLNVYEAIDEFVDTLETQFDSKVGYEFELRRLEAKVNDLYEEKDSLEGKVERLKENYNSRKEAIDATLKLNEFGVSNEEILRWKNILQRISTDLVKFDKRMDELGGIDGYVKEKRSELVSLDKKINERQIEVDRLENITMRIETDLNVLSSDFVKQVEDQLNRASGIIDTFEREFLSPETGFQVQATKIVEETHRRLRETLHTDERAWRKSIQVLNSEIAALVSEAENIRDDAFAGGKIVGQYKHLVHYSYILIGKDVGLIEALTTMHVTTDAFSEYLRDRKEMNLATSARRFGDEVRSRILDEKR